MYVWIFNFELLCKKKLVSTKPVHATVKVTNQETGIGNLVIYWSSFKICTWPKANYKRQ